VGQQVEVAVLRVDQTDNPKHPEKIALSLRALSKNPWTDADRHFPVGTTVRGRVTRVQPFGAFVELAPGLEGMVHISELGAGRRVTHPNEVLNAGDEVAATVLSIDLEKRRIALSLDPARQGTAEPGHQAADYAKPSQGMGTLGDLLRQTMAQAEGQRKTKRRP
jgi:small subunit ribosomal protein S1